MINSTNIDVVIRTTRSEVGHKKFTMTWQPNLFKELTDLIKAWGFGEDRVFLGVIHKKGRANQKEEFKVS